ncbi:toxin-antitoxin system YwqK family antitoxin [Winogradskyella vidalii]|uniref:toxin-antitoxin system YwqK family antitoxin n=1 Tax=Winogradskyella vidalii TaxID=2615024 RepID=UPI0015CE74AF|nr:hypothetical protein [Winogradskyella vidalii]
MNLFSKKIIQTTLVLTIGIFFLSTEVEAQQDTIYYNINWKETVKDSAAFFRPPVKKEGDLFRIEDYFVSGQLQMSGLSKTADNTIWQGKVSWYTNEGKVYQIGHYDNNRLEGEFISYLNNKKLVATYENGFFRGGAINRAQGSNSYYTEVKNDTIKEIIYGDDINGIRYENYSKLKGGRFLAKYYGENGELIGELVTLDNGYVKGVEVFYYFEPLSVKQIRYYPYERLLGETFFYENGQVRTKFELKPEYKSTFYTQEGVELGSLTYTINDGYLQPENGTEIKFSYSSITTQSNVINSINTYKEGKLQRTELRYQDGTTKSITNYINGVRELQISYDEDGEEIARMTYENYYPLTGTEISGNKQTTYLEGELVKEIDFYKESKLVFSEKTQDKEIYYDKKGNVLGTLELEYANKYAKALNGKRFYAGYNIDIASIETYKDGYVIERTTFTSKLSGKNEYTDFKRTTYFEDQGYKKLREVTYYSNGSKQSDFEYKGYDKKLGKFYNKNGDLIGTYDYEKKDGVLYEFFHESDVIRLIKEEVEGRVIKLKQYDYGVNRDYGEIDAVLVEELDVTCCSKSYKKDGEVFAELTYKDGEPWEGTVYDAVGRVKYTIAKGMRNGVYTKYGYGQNTILEEGQFVDDKKEGVLKIYNYNGQLQSSETYLNDKLEGKANYYDDKGALTHSLIYKDDKPFEGTKVIAGGYDIKPTEETYKNGLVTKRISYNKKGKQVTQYKDGKAVQTIAYHKDSDKKRLSYTVDDYFLNGEVIRYDKSGKEQHRALFENNKLASGTVFVTSRDTYDKRAAYIILNKNEKSMSVTVKGYDDEVLFFAEENLAAGNWVKYINKLNIYSTNLIPENLY